MLLQCLKFYTHDYKSNIENVTILEEEDWSQCTVILNGYLKFTNEAPIEPSKEMTVGNTVLSLIDVDESDFRVTVNLL